jgi:hypothetical protein
MPVLSGRSEYAGYSGGVARGLVFVVDDDQAVCRALSALIESAGYEARCFSAGADFIEAARTVRPAQGSRECG